MERPAHPQIEHVPPQAAQSARAPDLWRLGILPVMAIGTLFGLIGLYWDIAWHIDVGRDTFFTAPHNFLYTSMLIVLLMSLYGLFRDRRDTLLHLRLGRFRLHPGVLIIAIGAALELLFAPADELWHQFFGIDATLWAPMHLIGLLALTTAAFGGLIASWVERHLAPNAGRRRLFSRLTIYFAAALLAWNVILLAEYEFNVPAFPMFWHPLLLLGLPAFSLLMVARLKPLPWAATWTGLVFTLMQLLFAGVLTFTSSIDMAGDTRPMITLLLVSGIVADLVVRARLPVLLQGPLVGIAAIVPAYVLIALTGHIAWHAGALLIGLPAGLLLSVVTGCLASVVAAALNPTEVVEPERAKVPLSTVRT